MIFACECGVKFPTSEERFPIFCCCGRVAETSDSPLVTEGSHNAAESLPATPRVVSTCRHRGAVAHLVDCPTCYGHVKVKTFACGIHGECTIGKQVDGLQCCRECPDRTDTIAPQWITSRDQDSPKRRY